MKWKVFKRKGTIGKGRQMSNVIRLTGILRREDPEPSQTYADLEPTRPQTFTLQAYGIAKRRMHEIETQKAMLASLSRQDKWTAGGPY